MNLYFLMRTVVIFISRFIKANVVFSFLLLCLQTVDAWFCLILN